MRLLNRIACTMALCLMYAPLYAQRDDNISCHRVSLSLATTSSYSISFEAGYHHMFCKYLGAGGHIGYWGLYDVIGTASGDNWTILEEYNNPNCFYLRPSVVLKSPGLRIRGIKLGLYAEPGLMLNIPYQRVKIENTSNWSEPTYDRVSTTRGQWAAFELRLGVTIDIGRLGISFGYMKSNLDVYSQFRHLSYQGTSFREFYPHRPTMQGAFVTVSCIALK